MDWLIFFRTKQILIITSLFLFLGCKTVNSEKAESANLHLEIAIASMKGENYPAALKELLIAEELDPTNAMVQSELGLVYYFREHYDLSEKHFRRALSLRPDFTDAKNNLARAYVELGQFKKADSLLKEVLADLTFPDFPRALANYGFLEFKRKDYKSAITYLKKSLERDRENCSSQVLLGRSYLEMQDLDTAILQLDRAITFCTQTENDEGHYYSAISYFRNNQKDQAKLRFEEQLKFFPNGANAEKTHKMLDLINKGNL